MRGKQKRKRTIVLSPNGMKRFESCPAGYLYSNVPGTMPKIETTDILNVATTGRIVHDISESDFSDEVADMYLSTERERIRNEVEVLVSSARARDYTALTSVTELYMKVPFKNLGFIRGYADRVCKDGKKLLVVDLKTTGNPMFYDDRQQTLAYVTMLIYISREIVRFIGETGTADEDCIIQHISEYTGTTIEESRNIVSILGYTELRPTDCIMIVDYLRLDIIKRYDVTEYDIASFENRCTLSFRRISDTLAEWDRDHDVNRVVHRPGDCTFCPMRGKCIAYRVVVNAAFDPVNPDTVSTEEIIQELTQREHVAKLYTDRIIALKTALMMRFNEGDKVVTDGYKKVTRPIYTYPTDKVLKRLLPKMFKTPVKNIKFQTMIDWQQVYAAIYDIIGNFAPGSLKTSNIPKEYTDDVADLKEVYQSKPYLQKK